MKTFFSVVVLGCLFAAAACGLTGCNSTSAAPDKMSDTKSGMDDKMTGDKMAGDKMAGGKMATDKMSADKMGADKMSK